MSMFGDYKAYKKYEPAYDRWKYNRDLIDAKRQEYLKQHPEAVNQEDIQRGKTLLRAIDIIDEYSQKRAQDMEMAAGGMARLLIGLTEIGAVFGFIFLAGTKNGKKYLSKIANKYKLKNTIVQQWMPAIAGAIAGTIVSFPLVAWTAKTQVEASRKGRFEAMRKDLNNPNGFAVLTEEQIKEANELAKSIELKENKINNGLKNLKDMAVDSDEYKTQKAKFERELAEQEKHLNDKLTPKEIETAKKDQQLLTKLVEKIDISSQNYAENAELVVGILTSSILAGGAVTSYLAEKIAKMCKVKSPDKIGYMGQALTLFATAGASMLGSSLAKNASRVGRFKIKQELAQNPEQFVYVDDSKIANIENNIPIKQQKQGMWDFLKNLLKDKKEYNQYQKTTAQQEKRFYKAVEMLDLTPEQIKEAKRLQKNTFKTFNKVDEKSQKFSESIEALGESLNQIIGLVCMGTSMLIGMTFMGKSKHKSPRQTSIQGFLISMLGLIPAQFFAAYITKEQKRASRVADMIAINELSDYRHFR